jgi:hypothetical protein
MDLRVRSLQTPTGAITSNSKVRRKPRYWNPGSETILVAGPHWLASALVLHGGLHGFVAEQVGCQDIRVVIPERDRAIFFSGVCSAFVRNAVKNIASDMSLETIQL